MLKQADWTLTVDGIKDKERSCEQYVCLTLSFALDCLQEGRRSKRISTELACASGKPLIYEGCLAQVTSEIQL